MRIGRGELKVSPLKAATPEEAETLARRLYGMVPAVRVTDLLVEVDRWTGFSAAFAHLHTGLPAGDPRVVLTAVLADATNLGLTRMADACSVATYRQLAWTAGWHLREETYRRALAILVNAQQAQPLAARFGAADVSSSDGQHFPTGGPGEAVGAVNARYGRDATTLLYTHVSARHAPFHTVAIPPSGEAAHVIDGLLYHEADLTASTHHDLWRRRQRPRLRPGSCPRLPLRSPLPEPGGAAPSRVWAGRHLAGAGALHRRHRECKADHRSLGGRGSRLAASTRTGRVGASLMLKRLGAYPRQNSLAAALREVGRVERTLFTLRWFREPALRRLVTAELDENGHPVGRERWDGPPTRPEAGTWH